MSKLDDDLAAAYAAALKTDREVNIIRQAQKRWLKKRNGCTDAVCMKSAYVTQLESFIDEPKYGYCDDVQKANPYTDSCSYGKSGKGYTVCETYLKHLNNFKEIPYCQVPVPQDFKSPDWEDLDVLQHLELAYKIDIEYAKPAEWIPPDFESWSKTFLEKLEAGIISPHMRKVRIKLLGSSVTILAFTRDRLGCDKGYEKNIQESKWHSKGYIYWELTEDTSQLAKEVDVMMGMADMRLFAGKPYFIERLGTLQDPGFFIRHFFARMPYDDSGRLGYATELLCQIGHFKPLNEHTR